MSTISMSEAVKWARTATSGEYLIEYGSDEEIEALRTEAGEAGDLDQVALCNAAIEGDDAAIAKCRAVLDANDSGSRCGFDDQQIADLENILGARDLTLKADDRGLVAAEVSS